VSDAGTALHAVLQAARHRIVARLAARLGLGHLALADDALQVACLRALSAWPGDGVPLNPAGTSPGPTATTRPPRLRSVA